MQPSQAPYLCCYDYGQGGVWLLADASSPAEITRKYPGLTVYTQRPTWMTSGDEIKLRRELEAKEFCWNIHQPPTGWLLSYARDRGAVNLPPQVVRALGPIVPELRMSGFIPVVFEVSSSFGNFFVTFAGLRNSLTIAQDRGQLLVSGLPNHELQASGLWQAFSGPIKLHEQVKTWLAVQSGA